ncbi:MAG: hypothetical protein A3I05_07225 [Deltaproteobacteria bacterium RIFCSPLOWO2_02_FULL_44_10]|nr:MAG: hypothetical protein A3C46_04205 [Deltaproteobacteria bacterium RIFCSPHIGHO2_02_FULL_44_16]OGQ46383.1 MAG: hypothetical protein A3I05_07225 [Deltaproteobacteria bacterium RIFCSPLOWO2_02_FULL_44_10]
MKRGGLLAMTYVGFVEVCVILSPSTLLRANSAKNPDGILHPFRMTRRGNVIFQKKTFSFYLFLFLLLSFFALVLFYRLDHFTFWQDEAETALLAKSIFLHGVPQTLFDDVWITQFHGKESTSQHLWYFTPWLPFYLCALGFKLFGMNEWGGRVLFALSGFFSAIMLGLIAWKWIKNRSVVVWTLFFYVTNVSVILYTRQCKYYPLYLLGSCLALYGILKWHENRRGFFLTALGFLICFHCNYLSAFLAFFGFGCYTLSSKQLRPLFFKMLLTILVFFGPFLLLASMSERSNIVSQWPSVLLYFKKLGTQFYYWNGQVFPFLLGFLLCWFRPPFLKFIGLTIISSFLLLPLVGSDLFRYNLHLIPLFCLLLGYLLYRSFAWNKYFGLSLFSILTFTNILQNFPDAFVQKEIRPLFQKREWIALKNYYFKASQDPFKILPSFLPHLSPKNEHAFLNHDQMPWQWYLKMPLAYMAMSEKISSKTPPVPEHFLEKHEIDWWIGPHLVKMGDGPYLSEEEIVQLWREKGYRYERIDTQIPILYWDLNSPIRYRHFLERFSDDPKTTKTIHLIRRMK